MTSPYDKHLTIQSGHNLKVCHSPCHSIDQRAHWHCCATLRHHVAIMPNKRRAEREPREFGPELLK